MLKVGAREERKIIILVEGTGEKEVGGNGKGGNIIPGGLRGRGKENPGGQREEGGILVDSSSALHLLARYF